MAATAIDSMAAMAAACLNLCNASAMVAIANRRHSVAGGAVAWMIHKQ